MRRVLSKHPIAWSLLAVFIFICSLEFSSVILFYGPRFLMQNGTFLIQFFAESLVCVCGIALMFICGYGKMWDKTENFWRGLLCGGYILVTSAFSGFISLSFTLWSPEEMGYDKPLVFEPVWRIVIFVLTMFMIGIGEESFFRGVVSNLFWDKHASDPDGIRTAVIYSGMIFGLMHLININPLDLSGAGGVLVQVCAAMVMGMAMTAIYYRCRNIWAVIFLHGFLDLCGLLTAGLFGGSIMETVASYSPILAITNSLPYLIVTLVLLRKSKLQQMLAASDSLAVTGQNTVPGQPVMSSEYSKRSHKRAVALAVILWAVIFLTSVALSPDVQSSVSDLIDGSGLSFGGSVLSVENSGSSDGKETFGSQYSFTVEKDGDYTVKLKTNHGDSQAEVLIQILDADGEVRYEQNYGGNCSVTVSVGLDAGEYKLNLVYNYYKLKDKDVEYDTVVEIYQDILKK